MKTHIETIVNFVACQMDGEQVPPHNSAALVRLNEAIAAIHKNPSDPMLAILALSILGAVIHRVGAGLKAEQTLHAFIRPGDHHA